MKLEIDLIPKTSFYTNVRSCVSKERWDILRKNSYRKANYKCEICGDSGLNQGFNHPVECHEVWFFDEVTRKQILTRLISLCPYCHKSKHFGLAQLNNEEDIVVKHLMKINNITKKQVKEHIKESIKIWNKRNKINWELDISLIDLF